jgi:hypothetical protein
MKCKHCGEDFFDKETTQKITESMKNLEKSCSKINEEFEWIRNAKTIGDIPLTKLKQEKIRLKDVFEENRQIESIGLQERQNKLTKIVIILTLISISLTIYFGLLS